MLGAERSPMNQLFRGFMLCVLPLTLSLGILLPATSQLAVSPPSTSGSFVPSKVSRFGNIEVTSVPSQLTGKPLFEIASPTVLNRSNPGDKVPVEVRAAQISGTIDRTVTHFSQTKEAPQVLVSQLNGALVLVANSKARQFQLATVTDLDAYYEGQSQADVAAQWQKSLQQELTQEVRLTSPTIFVEYLLKALKLFLAILSVSGLLWFLQQSLRRKWKILKAQQKTQERHAKANLEGAETSDLQEDAIVQMRSQFLLTLQGFLSLKRQLWLYSSLRWLLFWGQVLLWYFGTFVIISQIPYLMRYRNWLWGTPIQILLIWFATGLSIRISHTLIDRFSQNWNNNHFLVQALGDSQRRLLRSATIKTAADGLVTFLLSTTGILGILNVLGIPTGSVLAGGAILGLAISFGSQSLVKDLVNGCLILAEDQFAVGDVVRLNSFQGLVENLNLRVTQLRSAEGKLITVSNSSITAVENLTRSWSRVDFSIEVAYEADLKTALEVLTQVAQQLYEDPEWNPKIPEPPEVLGVDNLSHTGMLLRVWIKTIPLEQWRVGREFRYRVRLAFEERNVPIGKPQLISSQGDETKGHGALSTSSDLHEKNV
jgi:moderate conductance mechanosensitive channel